MQKKIYLAGPYSHKDPEIMCHRSVLLSQKAAELIAQGHLVFSPVSHGVMIEGFGIAGDAKTWEAFNNSILEDWATDLYVLTIDGYKESVGVENEIRLAHDMEMDITFIDL